MRKYPDIDPMMSSYLDVGHRRHRGVDGGGGGGHGQQRGDGESHPGRGGLVVQPEGHPGHADRHEGRDVDGEHVVAELPLELHVHWEY